jgi:Holliday junction resolvase-like predicted endonuclease
LSEAIKDFEAQSVRLHLRMLAAFAETLAGAPGSYPRADRIESQALTLARGRQRRMTGDDPLPEPSFNKTLSHIAPTDAAHAALATVATVMNVVEIVREYDADDPQDAELDALASETTRILSEQFRLLKPAQSFPIVGTGNQGEHLVATMMRLRGYDVVALQNPSGHGIDLIAFKPDVGSNGLLIYLEIKTSLGDSAPGFSEAQKHPTSFVRSRLERAANGEGAYAHLSGAAKQLAAMLIQEIDNGRQIGGIKVMVTHVGKSLRLKIKVKRWGLPTARAVPPRGGRRR